MPSPYRKPWSKTEMTARSLSRTRPLTLTITLIRPAYCLCYSACNPFPDGPPLDACVELGADARGGSPDDRGNRHTVAGADGERRPPGRCGDGGGPRGSARAP